MTPLVIPTAQIPLLLSLCHPAASHQELATQVLTGADVPACYRNTPHLPPRKDQSDDIHHTLFGKGWLRSPMLG